MKNTTKIFGIESSSFYQLFLLYAVAHFGILLIPNAIFWDDWVIFNVTSAGILRIWQMAGSILNIEGYSHVAMLSVGPWTYKVLTFILMFFSGIALWKILEKQKWIDTNSRFLITLFFLLLPLNSARVALINFRYTLCAFAFFVAWSLLGKKRFRLLSLLLFFFCFTTNSLLFFYALPIAEWYFRDGNKLTFSNAIKWGLSRLDFFILPFIFWFIKTRFYKPYGLYATYNENFNPKNLIADPILMFEDLTKLHINVLFLFFFLALGYWLLNLPTPEQEQKSSRRLGLLGLIALGAGLFPYWIVGAIPTFQDWSSRHQLLMPLGVACLVVAMLNAFKSETSKAVAVFMVAFCLALNCQNYVDFFKDWSKQKEFLSLVLADPKIKEAKFIVIDDRTSNALNRNYRFYEWNGLMKLAFKDQTRFAVSLQELQPYQNGEYDRFVSESYNNKDHVRTADQASVLVRINYAEKPSSIFGRFKNFISGQPSYTLTVSPQKFTPNL